MFPFQKYIPQDKHPLVFLTKYDMLLCGYPEDYKPLDIFWMNKIQASDEQYRQSLMLDLTIISKRLNFEPILHRFKPTNNSSPYLFSQHDINIRISSLFIFLTHIKKVHEIVFNLDNMFQYGIHKIRSSFSNQDSYNKMMFLYLQHNEEERNFLSNNPQIANMHSSIIANNKQKYNQILQNINDFTPEKLVSKSKELSKILLLHIIKVRTVEIISHSEKNIFILYSRNKATFVQCYSFLEMCIGNPVAIRTSVDTIIDTLKNYIEKDELLSCIKKFFSDPQEENIITKYIIGDISCNQQDGLKNLAKLEDFIESLYKLMEELQTNQLQSSFDSINDEYKDNETLNLALINQNANPISRIKISQQQQVQQQQVQQQQVQQQQVQKQ